MIHCCSTGSSSNRGIHGPGWCRHRDVWPSCWLFLGMPLKSIAIVLWFDSSMITGVTLQRQKGEVSILDPCSLEEYSLQVMSFTSGLYSMRHLQYCLLSYTKFLQVAEGVANEGNIMVALMPSLHQVAAVVQSGHMTQDAVSQVTKIKCLVPIIKQSYCIFVTLGGPFLHQWLSEDLPCLAGHAG